MNDLITAKLEQGYKVVKDFSGMEDDLRKFAQGVKKKIMGCYFLASGDNPDRLAVAAHGYPMQLGYIGISSSTRDNTWMQRTYVIFAERPVDKRGESYKKESTRINVAIRNAAKFLTPFALHAAADKIAIYLVASRSSALGPIEQAKDVAQRKVFGYDARQALVDEIVYQFKAGLEVKNTQFAELLADFVEKKAKYDALVVDRPDGYDAVIPTLVNYELHKFYIVRLKFTGSSATAYVEADTEVHVEVARPDALPEHIQSAIPMLSMVGEDEYVEGFGCRASGDLYFVERRDA